MLGGTLNSSQGAINRSRSKNPYNNSAKPSYKLAFIPSSHFCYIFKTAQKRICPSAYHHFPSDPSPLLTAQPVSYYSQQYQTLSGYKNILFPTAKPHPVGLAPLTTCLDSDTDPVQTPGQTQYNSQWTCCVSCQDTYLCLTFQ